MRKHRLKQPAEPRAVAPPAAKPRPWLVRGLVRLVALVDRAPRALRPALWLTTWAIGVLLLKVFLLLLMRSLDSGQGQFELEPWILLNGSTILCALAFGLAREACRPDRASTPWILGQVVSWSVSLSAMTLAFLLGDQPDRGLDGAALTALIITGIGLTIGVVLWRHKARRFGRD